MKRSFLIDTHALLWFLSDDISLSERARQIILSTDNRCYVSIASLLEIAIKINLGKLTFSSDFTKLAEVLFENDIEILQITFDHICKLSTLEDVHRDPFDRIIIAMSVVEKLTVISKDRNFTKYLEAEVIWD